MRVVSGQQGEIMQSSPKSELCSIQCWTLGARHIAGIHIHMLDKTGGNKAR